MPPFLVVNKVPPLGVCRGVPLLGAAVVCTSSEKGTKAENVFESSSDHASRDNMGRTVRPICHHVSFT